MIEQLLVAKCWLRKRIPKEKVQIDVNDEFANIENNMEVEIIDMELADIDPMDTEFLQRMVPQECSADSTRETDLDSDMDYQTDCQTDYQTENLLGDPRPSPSTQLTQHTQHTQRTPHTPRKRKAKETPIINTPLTGRLRKHIKKNYRE